MNLTPIVFLTTNIQVISLYWQSMLCGYQCCEMQFRKHVGEYCWSGYLLNWGDGKERSGQLLTQAGFEERGEVAGGSCLLPT